MFVVGSRQNPSGVKEATLGIQMKGVTLYVVLRAILLAHNVILLM
jgi:hypothetical protein